MLTMMNISRKEEATTTQALQPPSARLPRCALADRPAIRVTHPDPAIRVAHPDQGPAVHVCLPTTSPSS